MSAMQVGRTATDAHQVHKHAQLVLYALPDRKPVQTSENRSDVIPCPDSSDKPGSCVLDSLKWIDCHLGESGENRVTVVEPGCHES
jgi:hypothetical protein